MEIEEKREKKKIVSTKPEIHRPRTPSKDGEVVEKIQMPPRKPLFGCRMAPHMPSEWH